VWIGAPLDQHMVEFGVLSSSKLNANILHDPTNRRRDGFHNR
jgi:hypothetical protein